MAGAVPVVVIVDLVTSAAAPGASSIVEIGMATNIFFISKPLFSGHLYKASIA
jgi:hypothetical protein